MISEKEFINSYRCTSVHFIRKEEMFLDLEIRDIYKNHDDFIMRWDRLSIKKQKEYEEASFWSRAFAPVTVGISGYDINHY